MVLPCTDSVVAAVYFNKSSSQQCVAIVQHRRGLGLLGSAASETVAGAGAAPTALASSYIKCSKHLLGSSE
jgi:hypothetical protein